MAFVFVSGRRLVKATWLAYKKLFMLGVKDNILEAIGNPVGLCFRERADACSGHLGCQKKTKFIWFGVNKYLNRIEVAIS